MIELEPEVAQAISALYQSIHASVYKTLSPKRREQEIESVADQIFGVYMRVITTKKEDRAGLLRELFKRYEIAPDR
jgi:hypothetical protein